MPASQRLQDRISGGEARDTDWPIAPQAGLCMARLALAFSRTRTP
jgi:hypothetical protein